MWKRFTRKSQAAEPGTSVKKYITRSELQRLKDGFLITKERPAVTEVVAWLGGNDDRTENAAYQFGKQRLRWPIALAGSSITVIRKSRLGLYCVPSMCQILLVEDIS